MSGVLVRWKDADDSPGSWLPLHPVEAQNTGFFEARRYVLSKPSENARLYIDDEPLSDDPANRDCWLWEPGFFAGEVTAELTDANGDTIATYLLDVAPDPSKLGREVFSAMLRDLWEDDPNWVIGAEPAMTDIADSGVSEDPWLAFARLRRYGHETVSALNAIAASPRRALRVNRESAPIEAVRRVDRRTACALARMPGAVSIILGVGAEGGGDDGARLDVPKTRETLDCAANRTMLALQIALLRRTHRVCEELSRRVAHEPPSDTRTPLGARWPRRQAFLDGLSAKLGRSIRSLPWRDVARAEVSAAGLTAVAADPAYSRAWGRGWRALRLGMEQGELSERLWISPSWEIYERWCFVKIGRMLIDALPEWRWRKTRNTRTGRRGDRCVWLELQPTFRAGPLGPDKRWSISKERIPDVLLSAEGPGCLRFLLLDAKYRSSRQNVLDAMTSAHVYRDSLRIGQQRPDGALLLVPAAYGAEHLRDPEFQRIHRVGATVFAPAADVCLPSLVAEFLAEWNHE